MLGAPRGPIRARPPQTTTATDVKATLQTSHGPIVLELDDAAAPKTCENFRRYADEGHYAGTIFHRVIPDFMIQGGGFTADMDQKPTRANVRSEADNGLVNGRGTVAMARTPDPHSASSQFFINLKDNEFLNHRDTSQAGYGYTVFGRVVEGMDAVDAIAAVPTGTAGAHRDVPSEPVTIDAVTVED